MRRLTRYVVALTATATCLGAAVSVSHALEPAPVAARDVVPPVAAAPVGASGVGELLDAVSVGAADTLAKQREILEYWTDDRMRSAVPIPRRTLQRPKRFPIPLEPLVPPLPAGGADAETSQPGPGQPGPTQPTPEQPAPVQPGPVEPEPVEPEPVEPEPVEPEPAASEPQTRAADGSLVPGDLLGGLGAPAAAPAAPAAPQPAPRVAADGGGYPWAGGGPITRTTGKVFFTLNGTDYVCSASTVRSANRDTVLTAGHCVNNGPGDFATRFVFVPAYRDGSRPYGTWTARRMLTPTPWSQKGDVDFDVAFAILNTNAGRHVTDVVGAQPIAFNSARGAYTYSFGYPSVGGYNGARLFYCRGTAKRDKYGSADQGIPCDMTEGSSGGPWLTGFNPRTGQGTLTSVNSFGYDDMPEVMFGPYFGERVRALYLHAHRA